MNIFRCRHMAHGMLQTGTVSHDIISDITHHYHTMSCHDVSCHHLSNMFSLHLKPSTIPEPEAVGNTFRRTCLFCMLGVGSCRCKLWMPTALARTGQLNARERQTWKNTWDYLNPLRTRLNDLKWAVTFIPMPVSKIVRRTHLHNKWYSIKIVYFFWAGARS